MSSLWFVVPAHGRPELAAICLRQLRRTCDLLTAEGVYATAVVVADDENLDTARALGFATVERDNYFLSRKFNDGIQLALDPRHNPYPADYVVPCGSDDWVDHRLFLDLPGPDTMVGFQRLSVVREDGRELTVRQLNYQGGAGIRIYPAALMRPLDYRPADPDRKRACDTSILTNLSRVWNDGPTSPGYRQRGEYGIAEIRTSGRMRIEHRHLHDHQIVDWKSPDVQLNSYDTLTVFRAEKPCDPFDALAGVYPAEALEEMQALYVSRRELVAA